MSPRRLDYWPPTSTPRRTGAVPDPESPTLRERFARRVQVDPATGCAIWTGSCDTNGYGTIRIGGKYGKTWRAHHVAWVFAYGLEALPVDGRKVCHSCDVPACVLVEHLYLATHAERMEHKRQRGRAAHDDRSRLGPRVPATGERHSSRTHPERIPRGERARDARLTEAQVLEIREATGRTHAELGAVYGVTPEAIGRVRRGESWAHVGGPRTHAGKGHGRGGKPR